MRILKDQIVEVEKSYLNSPKANEFQKLKTKTTTQIDYSGLLHLLNKKFDLEEFKTLCLEYRMSYPQLDYDNIAGSTKEAKARELILYLERRDRINDFYDFVTDYIASRE